MNTHYCKKFFAVNFCLLALAKPCALLSQALPVAKEVQYQILPDGIEHWSIGSDEAKSPPEFFRFIEEIAGVIFGKNEMPFQRTVVFLVGISRYAHITPSLPFVENDIEDLRQYFLSEGGADEIYIARNAVATAELVENYMVNIFREKLQPQDRLVFYFAGHGTDGGGTTGYIQLYDAKRNDFASGLLKISDAKEWSRLIPAKHVLFLFDSCSSGLGIIPRSKRSNIQEQIISTLSNGGSRTVITAGLDDQQTFEVPSASDRDKGNGVFTRALLESLRSRYGSGFLTVNEVHADLARRVAAFAAANGKDITPRLWPLDEEDFPGTFLFINQDPESLKRSVGKYQSYLNARPRRDSARSERLAWQENTSANRAEKEFYLRLYGEGRVALEYNFFSRVNGDWNYNSLVSHKYWGLLVKRKARFSPYDDHSSYNWTIEYSHNISRSYSIDADYAWDPEHSLLELAFHRERLPSKKLRFRTVRDMSVSNCEPAKGIYYRYFIYYFDGSSTMHRMFDGVIDYSNYVFQETARVHVASEVSGLWLYLVPEDGQPLSVHDASLHSGRNLLDNGEPKALSYTGPPRVAGEYTVKTGPYFLIAVSRRDHPRNNDIWWWKVDILRESNYMRILPDLSLNADGQMITKKPFRTFFGEDAIDPETVIGPCEIKHNMER